jgi:hypothetical protein
MESFVLQPAEECTYRWISLKLKTFDGMAF